MNNEQEKQRIERVALTCLQGLLSNSYYIDKVCDGKDSASITAIEQAKGFIKKLDQEFNLMDLGHKSHDDKQV